MDARADASSGDASDEAPSLAVRSLDTRVRFLPCLIRVETVCTHALWALTAVPGTT